MNHRTNALLAAIMVALIILASSAYIINERQIAVVTQFSRLISTDDEAGLKFKVPFVQNVEFFDARIQRLDVEPERFMTNEKKWLIVDYFVEWRINDIRTFYTSVQGNFDQASRLLDNMVKENLRGEFVQRSVKEAISQDRGTIMDAASKRISSQAEARYGIEVLGVRLKRVDFSDEIRDRVFDRMRAERERVSKDFRARGQEKSSVIRATAERRLHISGRHRTRTVNIKTHNIRHAITSRKRTAAAYLVTCPSPAPAITGATARTPSTFSKE